MGEYMYMRGGAGGEEAQGNYMRGDGIRWRSVSAIPVGFSYSVQSEAEASFLDQILPWLCVLCLFLYC